MLFSLSRLYKIPIFINSIFSHMLIFKGIIESQTLNIYLIHYRSKPSGPSGSKSADIAFVFLFRHSNGIQEQPQRSDAIPKTGVALVPPERNRSRPSSRVKTALNYTYRGCYVRCNQCIGGGLLNLSQGSG